MRRVFTVVIEDFKPTEVYYESGRLASADTVDDLVARLSKIKRAWIYLAHGYVDDLKQRCYKIGLSINPEVRLGKLWLTPIHTIECAYSGRVFCETLVHWFYIDRMRWIEREYFDLTLEDVELFKMCQTEDDLRKTFQPRPDIMRISKRDIEPLYAEMRENGSQTIAEHLDRIARLNLRRVLGL